MLKCLGQLGPCHLINHIHVKKKNLQKILKILKKINYEITHLILVGAVSYEKRTITGWGKQPWELLRSVLWTVDKHSLLCVSFFVLLVVFAVLVVSPPFLLCPPSFSNKPLPSVMKILWKPLFYAVLLPVSFLARLSHLQVTKVSSSETDSEHVTFAPTLSKHAGTVKQTAQTEAHVALTSLLWLLINMQFIKAGSYTSYSIPARNDTFASNRCFSIPTLRTTPSHRAHNWGLLPQETCHNYI